MGINTANELYKSISQHIAVLLTRMGVTEQPILLSVENDSAEPEVDLQQRTYSGTDGQKWQFICEDESRVRIRSALGTYIDNYAGNVAEANNVWMYEKSDSASQLWMLTPIVAESEAG